MTLQVFSRNNQRSKVIGLAGSVFFQFFALAAQIAVIANLYWMMSKFCKYYLEV
ncbi:exported hypothetical protein [Agrobacterium genomosp. 13 str. CFBP 6927]|uniref:Uncharacterized protein n=1 Tax=Agrobacterium genomosp. 13 str. CFBP 6927 TaxID=1183428 RepID=A0ABM9VB45_9HYPH|nr:exported hypothetical protein [Agrobacterium genomosp. 13 str. CFBP 6927]